MIGWKLLVPALLCVTLGAAIAWDAAEEPSAAIARDAPVPPPPRTPTRAPAAGMPPIAGYAAFIERPPFSESRRPSVRTGASMAERPPFDLSGIVITPTRRSALFSRPGSPEILRRPEGQALDGWTVERILADRVVLRGAQRQLELKIGPAPTGVPVGGPIGGATLATPVAAPTGVVITPRNLTSPKDTRWLTR